MTITAVKGDLLGQNVDVIVNAWELKYPSVVVTD
jgi:hypothetical protein